MGAARKHHELLAWQEAIKLVEQTYRMTRHFPREEAYGLTSQMRRAAVSVPSNIAEGAGRGGRKEFIQFLSVARGSLCELETQLIVAKKLGLTTDSATVEHHLEKTFALIGGLINSTRKQVTK
ncbi:MAG: four helix bundle protein [Gammaproteobacteria bacterium]